MSTQEASAALAGSIAAESTPATAAPATHTTAGNLNSVPGVGASANAGAPANLPPVTVPAPLADVLVQSLARFDELVADLERINQPQLQSHIEAITALDPTDAYNKLSTLERWALELNIREAREMQLGRELDVFGDPPPAVAEILASVPPPNPAPASSGNVLPTMLPVHAAAAVAALQAAAVAQAQGQAQGAPAPTSSGTHGASQTPEGAAAAQAQFLAMQQALTSMYGGGGAIGAASAANMTPAQFFAAMQQHAAKMLAARAAHANAAASGAGNAAASNSSLAPASAPATLDRYLASLQEKQ